MMVRLILTTVSEPHPQTRERGWTQTTYRVSPETANRLITTASNALYDGTMPQTERIVITVFPTPDCPAGWPAFGDDWR